MSFHLVSQKKAVNEKLFGQHHRAVIYNGAPEYEAIMLAEVSGDYIPRVSDVQEERGKVLVMGEFLHLHIVTSLHAWFGV